MLVVIGVTMGRHIDGEDAVRQALREQERAAVEDRRARDDQIRVWTIALEADPASALALAQLAGLHAQRARESGDETGYTAAEDFARRSLAQRTERNGKTFVTLAAALLAQHRFSEARAVAALAVSTEPDVPQYRALLGELHAELGAYDSAATHFSQLGRQRSHLSIAPRLARWAELTGRPHEARKLLERAVAEAQTRPDLPREQVAWFHVRLGDHLRRHGKPRSARRQLREALAVNPGDYRALRALSALELVAGDFSSAVTFAREAVRGSRTPETLIAFADALLASGDSSAADSVHNEVGNIIKAESGRFERAWYAHQLDWQRNVEAVTRILEEEIRDRADVHGYDLLAWAYYRSGRISEARSASTRALRTEVSDAVIWSHAGIIAHAAGDHAAAGAYLRRARELNPRFDPVFAAHAREILRTSPTASRRLQPTAGFDRVGFSNALTPPSS